MSSNLDILRSHSSILNKPKTTTLMEQATGPQIAAPKPTVVKPSVQATQDRQYGMTDSGTGKTVDSVMPALTVKPLSSPAKNTLEQILHQPNKIADIANRENVRQMEARAALRQDTTTKNAGRSYQQNLIQKQKDNLQAQINDVMAQIEAETDARDNKARVELSQTLSDLNVRMNKLDSNLAGLNVADVSDWEERQYNEIMASGGSGLFITLEKLSGLTDAKIREAVDRGDERRSELTDLEKEYFAKYDELKGKYGDKVDSWLDYIERMKNSKEMDELLKKAQAKAADKPFWSSLGSIGLNAASGGGYMDIVGQKLQRFATGSDAPIDYNSPAQRPAKITQAIRGEVSKDMGAGGRFLYNTAMSLGDSAVAIGLSKAGLGNLGTVLLGGAAATNATHAAAERGATDGQALLIGLIAGASETLLEKASIDKLFSLKDPKTLKGVILNVLKQIGAEGAEEGLTNIVNTIADGLILRDKSELETIKRQLMADGMSRDQAEIAAITEWAKGFALDVGGGMLSGAATGSVKSGMDYARSNLGGRQPTVDSAMPTIPQAEQQTQPAQPTASAMPTVDNVMPRVQTGQAAETDNPNTTPTAEQIVRPDEQNRTEEVKKPAMGAADEGFNPYSHYQNTQSRFIPEGANAARPVDVPAVDPTGKNTRRFLSNVMGAQSLTKGTDAKLQEDFMAGKYGYEVKGDKAAVDAARAKLENGNYDTLRGATLERLESLKDLKQTVVDAQILALEAMRNGRDADAAELFLMLGNTGTEFAQAIQAASILRKLSPEGQLEGALRVAARLDAKTKKNRGGQRATEVSAEEQSEIMQTVDDVRETALRLLGNIHEALDTGRDNGVPVEDWLKEIGKKLANVVSSSKNANRGGTRTVAKTIEADLKAFANDYITKYKPVPKYQHAEAVENFLNNPEEYAEAWSEAKTELREKYKDDEAMLAALDDFLNGEINLDQIGGGITKDINKAISDIGAKTSEIIRSNKSDKAAVAQQVTDMLMKDHQLSEKDAGKMANFILKKFNEHVATRSKAALESMFKDRGKKPPKTVMQRFSELANMGAFTSSKYNQKATQKLFGEGLVVDPDLAQKFLDAPDEASREAAMEEIYKDLGEQLDTSFGEVLTRWRYTAMLLAPSTHIKNTLGSTTQFGMGLLKDALATPIEAAVDKITKGKTGRTKAYLNLKSEADLSLLNTAGEFYDQHRDDIMGESRYRDTPAGKINQYKTVMKLNNPTTKVGRAVDTILRATGKVADANATAMDTEDMWISKPRFQTALAGYMKANGLTEVTDAAYEYAKNEAQKTTYRERNALSDWASGLGKHTNNPFSKVVSFFINSNFPFKRSYANMGVRAVEYSPVGLFTHTIPDIARAARAKDPKMVATIIDDLAANVSGTLLTGLGVFLAKEGLLRARGPEDDKERKQLKQEGYLENAFYIGDTPIPISFLGSVSIPLLMGASIYEAIARSNNTEEGMTLGDYLEVTSRILDPLTETTMFEGVMDAVNDFASNNPDESLSSAVAAGIFTTIGNYIGSLIPTVVSRIAGALDRSQRTTYVEPDSQLPQVDKMVQGILKKDPIGRKTLTEKVDAYGDIVPGGLPDTGSTAKDVAGAVGYVFTPTFPGKIKTTAVDEEMRRLYNDPTVDRDKYTLFVSDAPKSFSVDGKDVKLTSEQYTQFAQDRNSGIQSMRNSVLTNESYENLSGNAKAKAMNDAKEYAEALAKAGLDVGYKLPEAWMEKLAGATPEEAAAAIIENAIKAEAQNIGANTYLGLGEMLSNKSIDEQLAAACLGATSQTAYGAYEANCVPAGVNVSQFLDAYGTAKAADKNNGDIQKQAALNYIEKMDLTPEQKGALASAVFSAIGKTVRIDSPVSEQWLLDTGDIDRLEIQMGRDQEKQPERYVAYKKYIKDSSVDMQTYLDFYNFQKSDEAKGENRQDKIIDWLEELDAPDEVKGRLFCTVYKRTSCPLKWRTDVPRD